MPFQNMPLWHEDNFKLKALDKQQMQEGHSNLFLFFLKAGDTIFHVKDALPVPGEKNVISWEVMAGGRGGSVPTDLVKMC